MSDTTEAARRTAGFARVRVKICGITRPEDAALAERAGADAIGMIFAERSKRRVDAMQAAEIAAAVGPLVTRVGVFVDASPDDVRRLVGALRLDGDQGWGRLSLHLHGAETPAVAAALRPSVQVIKAWSFTPGLRPEVMTRYPADAVLIDGLRPGSGERFDWEQAAGLRQLPRLILAGGLDPENVAEGIAALRPYAVDVASGVESEPGVKDPAKVHAFVEAVRAAEAA